MLEAKKLQLETEGVTVRDSEFSCGLRSFGTQDYEQAAKELTVTGARKVGAVEAPAV
jgi:hypothetical protein